MNVRNGRLMTRHALSLTAHEHKSNRDSFGLNKMCQFLVKTYCLWHKQLKNEIILGGHHAPFFRKWVRLLLFSTFEVWSEWEKGDLLAIRQQL